MAIDKERAAGWDKRSRMDVADWRQQVLHDHSAAVVAVIGTDALVEDWLLGESEEGVTGRMLQCATSLDAVLEVPGPAHAQKPSHSALFVPSHVANECQFGFVLRSGRDAARRARMVLLSRVDRTVLCVSAIKNRLGRTVMNSYKIRGFDGGRLTGSTFQADGEYSFRFRVRRVFSMAPRSRWRRCEGSNRSRSFRNDLQPLRARIVWPVRRGDDLWGVFKQLFRRIDRTIHVLTTQRDEELYLQLHSCFGRHYDKVQEQLGNIRYWPITPDKSAQRPPPTDAGPAVAARSEDATNAGLYRCDQCASTFRCAYRLRRHHSAVHLQERKWKCDQCDRRYTQSSHLREHIKHVHQKIQHFECPLCNSRFRWKTNFNRHMRTAHPGAPRASGSAGARDENGR